MNAIVCLSGSNEMKVVKYIEDSKVVELEEAVQHMQYYEAFDLALKICLNNAFRLSNYCKKISKPFPANEELNYTAEKLIEYQFGQLISNFLSSYYQFLEFCKYNAGKWFGTDVRQETEKIISEFYDDGFTYSFVAKFRTYITHFGLPIHASWVNTDQEKRQRCFILMPRVLLQSGESWGSKLKAELEQIDALGNMLNLLEIFSISEKIIGAIAKEIDTYYRQLFSSSIEIISGLLDGENLKKDKFYLLKFASIERIEDICEKPADFEMYEIPILALV